MANKRITELAVITTLTGSEVSEAVQGGVNVQITKANEKTFYTTDLPSPTNPQDAATKAYAESLVVGLWDDRGNFDASVNAYPSSGGSGTAGAILKGDIWTVSVGGTLPTGLVVAAGDTVRALVNTPGNTQSNWAIAENNIGYVPENQANKENTTLDTSTTKYPTNRLVKEYVDNATPPDASETVNGIVEEATVAEIWSGASIGGTGAKLIITPAKQNSSRAVVDLGNLSGAVSIDLSLGRNFKCAFTGNVTSFTFTNEVLGEVYYLDITRVTTNYTIAFTAAKFRFPLGLAPILTDPSTNGVGTAIDTLVFKCGVTGRLDVVITPDLQTN